MMMPRLIEAFTLFIVLPTVLFLEPFPIPKIPALLVFAGYCLIRLFKDKNWNNSDFLKFDENDWSMLPAIFLRFFCFCLILFPATWYFSPDLFLAFPKQDPRTYIMVIIFYPFLSALPQELIYRSFFFHLLKPMLSSGLLLVLFSALAFSYLHIIYDNFIALTLTFAGGLLFSYTYKNSKSLILISIEHALYGIAIFTSGLGHYFYEPFA